MVESRSFEEILIECENAVNSFEMFRAYEILEDELKSFDKNPRTIVCEGKILASLNKIDEAIEAFSECINLFKEHRESYVERGYYRVRKGEVLEGYLDLKKAVELEDIVDGKITLAKSAMTLGKYEESRDVYKELLNRFSPSVVQSNFISSNKYLIKELEEKKLNEKLTLKEKVSLGKSYMYTNMWNEALREIEDVYESIEDYDDLIVAGWILGKSGEMEKCYELLDKAISQNEDMGKAYLFKGTSLEGEGRLKEAYKVINEGIKREPTYDASYVNLARICLALGKYNEGLKYCEKSIEFNFKEYYARYLKGCFLNRLGNFKEALKTLDNALALFQNDGDFYAEKSYSLRNLGGIREANEICEEALGYGFDTEKLNLEKGLILKAVEYYDNAITWFEVVVEMNPRNEIALFFKNICSIYLGNYKDALEGFKNMRSLGFNEPLIYGGEFLAYYNLGDNEGCISTIKSYSKSVNNDSKEYKKDGYKLIQAINSSPSKLKWDSEYENIKDKINEFISKS